MAVSSSADPTPSMGVSGTGRGAPAVRWRGKSSFTGHTDCAPADRVKLYAIRYSVGLPVYGLPYSQPKPAGASAPDSTYVPRAWPTRDRRLLTQEFLDNASDRGHVIDSVYVATTTWDLMILDRLAKLS